MLKTNTTTYLDYLICFLIMKKHRLKAIDALYPTEITNFLYAKKRTISPVVKNIREWVTSAFFSE